MTFALDEVLVYTVSERERVYIHPQKPDGCTELRKLLSTGQSGRPKIASCTSLGVSEE